MLSNIDKNYLITKYSKNFGGDHFLKSEYKEPEGDAFIHYLIMRNDFLGVFILLESGVDPNIRGDMSYTPLHYSLSEAECLDISLLLLQKGALLSEPDEFKVTPLDQIFINTVELQKVDKPLYLRPIALSSLDIQYIYESLNLNSNNLLDKDTLLYEAFSQMNIKCAYLLLKAGANLTKKNQVSNKNCLELYDDLKKDNKKFINQHDLISNSLSLSQKNELYFNFWINVFMTRKLWNSEFKQ